MPCFFSWLNVKLGWCVKFWKDYKVKKTSAHREAPNDHAGDGWTSDCTGAPFMTLYLHV